MQHTSGALRLSLGPAASRRGLSDRQPGPSAPSLCEVPEAVEATAPDDRHDEENEEKREHARGGALDRPGKRLALLAEMHRRLWDVVPYLPLGQFIQPFLWRGNISGVLRSNVLAFWNISKA